MTLWVILTSFVLILATGVPQGNDGKAHGEAHQRQGGTVYVF